MNRKKTLALGVPVLFLLFLLAAGLDKGTHLFDFRFVQFQSPLFFIAILFLCLGAFLMFALLTIFPPRFRPRIPLPKMLTRPAQKAGTAMQRAGWEAEMGNTTEAKTLLENVSPGDPDYGGARRLLADLASEQANDEECEFHYQQALKVVSGKERAAVMMALAHVYERQKKDEMARDLYLEAARLAPEAPAPYFHLRALAVSEEEWEDALMWQTHLEESFPEALNGDEESAMRISLRYQFAVSRFQQGEYKNAQSLMKHVLRLTDTFVPAYLLSGEICEKLDNGSAAIKTWERGFDATGHPALMLRVSEALLAENLPDKAVEYAQRCVRQNPGNPQVEFALGNLYLRLEMNREALQVFEQLNSRHPDWPLNTRTLADLYRKTGEFRNASSLYSGILDQPQAILEWVCTSCFTPFDRYRDRCSSCFEWNTIEINYQAGNMDIDAKNTAYRY